MVKQKIIVTEDISHLLVDLEQREVALWLHSMPEGEDVEKCLPAFLRLPWQLIVSEISDAALIGSLDESEDATDSMVRKRGFIQIVDDNPSEIELPQRCLPVYLLNGRGERSLSNHKKQLIRMTMLEKLRRSNARRVLVLSGIGDPIPPDLGELWLDEFRARVSFATDTADAKEKLETWADEFDGHNVLSLLSLPTGPIVTKIIEHYESTYPDARTVIRLRDLSGNIKKLDITGLDDPERPLLDKYSLIEEKHLPMLTPDNISEEEFIDFFRDSTNSWRPYAAGLPWKQDNKTTDHFLRLLDDICSRGLDQSCIAYVQTESGAGGTTFVRMLAWESAQRGYPVLIAKQSYFSPDILQVDGFLHSVQQKTPSKAHEIPWVIVYDRIHWDNNDAGLVQFLNGLKRHGRSVCILVVSGPLEGRKAFSGSFQQIEHLTHALDKDETQELGKHLNKFLGHYKKARSPSEWEEYYDMHTIHYSEGASAFWVVLRFWIQRQHDLSETIQDWVYRSFKELTEDDDIRYAILEIAAMSSERWPIPEDLLRPPQESKWPTSHRLEDDRTTLGSLGLVSFKVTGRKHWALTHDILGRWLINALFYDRESLNKFGFGDARDSTHLRFLLLERISKKQELGMVIHREIGEEFARSIFKIDPGNGRGEFMDFWREALAALDAMATPLRRTSRPFNHHTAVSRRRISEPINDRQEDRYEVTDEERIDLLSPGD